MGFKSIDLLEKIKETLETVFWIGGSVAIIYYGDGRANLAKVITQDDRVSRIPLLVAIVSALLNLLVFLYLVIYLPFLKNDRREWQVASPWAIPLGTLCGIITFIG